MPLAKMLLCSLAARGPYHGANSSGSAASSSTLSIAKPSGIGDGALLIAFVVNQSLGKTATPPAGWTKLIDTASRSVHYKVSTASEPSNYIWNFSDSVTSQGFIVVLASGQYDAIGAMGSNASPAIAPSVTAAAANSMALAWFSEKAASTSFSTPSGWTALVADSDATTPSAALFYKAVNAGATGDATSTVTPSSPSRGIQIVVKPR